MAEGQVAGRGAVWERCILHINTSETVSKKKHHSDPGAIKGCPVAVRSDQAEAEINLETIPKVQTRNNERLS